MNWHIYLRTDTKRRKLKGINNPWNANRPVKVSRDGTEVETKVGERLVEEFGLSASQLPVYKSNDM